MREVGIVTDSAIDIPADLARELDIVIAPVTFIIDDVVYPIHGGIDRSMIVDRLAAAKKLSTSGCNPQDFYDAYTAVLTRAKSVVAPILAQQLSVTFNSAVTAAELIEDATITVYDTKTVCIGQLPIVLEAARRAQAGVSFEQVCGLVEGALTTLQGLAISTNLALIRSIGRVTDESSAGAPQMRLAVVALEGRIRPFDAAADFDEAIAKVIACVSKVAGDRPIYATVGHTRQPEAAGKLRQALEERFRCRALDQVDECPTGALLSGVGQVSLGFFVEP